MPNLVPAESELIPQVSTPQSAPNSTAVLSDDESPAKSQPLEDGLRKDSQSTLDTALVEKPEPVQGLDNAPGEGSTINVPEKIESLSRTSAHFSPAGNVEDLAHEGAVEASSALPEKVRYGAPDGPRQKRRERYDGREPLDYPGHEAVAQFLATPKSDREFKSLTALGKYFKVTRMTVHRWKQDIDVMQRAHWLSMRHQMAGDLVARREFPQIMETAVRLAKAGDVQAMKFCASRAWSEELRVEHSQVSATVSLKDLFGDEPEEPQDENGRAEGGGR